MELRVGEECLWQTACVFLRNDDVFILRKFRLDCLRKMLVVVWADNAFYDCDSECADVFDKALWRTEPANDCCCERLIFFVVC